MTWTTTGPSIQLSNRRRLGLSIAALLLADSLAGYEEHMPSWPPGGGGVLLTVVGHRRPRRSVFCRNRCTVSSKLRGLGISALPPRSTTSTLLLPSPARLSLFTKMETVLPTFCSTFDDIILMASSPSLLHHITAHLYSEFAMINPHHFLGISMTHDRVHCQPPPTGWHVRVPPD